MSGNAFAPQQNTFTFTASTTAPPGVQVGNVGIAIGVSNTQHLVTNISPSIVAFVSWSTVSSADAQAKAVIPTGTSQFCWPLLPSSTQTFTAPPGAWWSGITSSGSAAIYVTPGDGL